MSIMSSPFLTALIKGLIPQILYVFVKNVMGTNELTLAILSSVMQFIFEKTQLVWIDRCSQQNNSEKSKGIDLKLKKANTTMTGYSVPYMDSNTIYPSIEYMVKFGSHWTNFWCRSGQALSHWFGYWKMIFLA